jgi:hypothetical protein
MTAPSRRNTELLCPPSILGIGIRYVERAVEGTIALPEIDNVRPFRRLAVTLLCFWAPRGPPR